MTEMPLVETSPFVAHDEKMREETQAHPSETRPESQSEGQAEEAVDTENA